MSQSFSTPILFLIFNRPDTTQKVFDQIKKLKPEFLYIAADGPRDDVLGEKEKCAETRSIIDKIDWQCTVKTLLRTENLKCGLAVSSAITWFFENVDEGIILEDDCYPDESFFLYCNELLIKYRNSDRIKIIGANTFQNGISRGNGSYYFSRHAHIWGWATWKRVWNEYDYEMHDLEDRINDGTFNHILVSKRQRRHFYKIFSLIKSKKINTWDFQLAYSIWKNDGIVITPNINMIENIGFQNNSTHKFLNDSQKILKANQISFPLIHPQIEVNVQADNFTYNNVYGHSISRLIRLIKENGLITIFKYVCNRNY